MASTKSGAGVSPDLKMEAQDDTDAGATLATLIADHNALLAKLRAAGLMRS